MLARRFFISGWAKSAICLTAAASLQACAATSPSYFTGTITPESGTCQPAGRALLAIKDGFVRFTPHEGVVTLTGTLTAAGAITAQATITSLDHTSYYQSLTAALNGTAVTGTFITSNCRYRLHLMAAAP